MKWVNGFRSDLTQDSESPCYTRSVCTSGGSSWGWGSGGRGVDACGYVDHADTEPGYFRLGRLVIAADLGSATSRGRRPENSWMVKVSNGEALVVMAWGLSRSGAEHLASRLAGVISGALTRSDTGSSLGPEGPVA